MLTVYKIKSFFDSLVYTMQVESVVYEATYSTITVNNLYFLVAGKDIVINETAYTVASIDFCTNSFTVQADLTGIEVTEIQLDNPFFVWGTPLQAQTEISNTFSNKYPLIYLKEIIREKQMDVFSGIDRESEIKIFFLDEMNKADWHTREFYSELLVSLNNWVDYVISQLLSNTSFYTDETVFERVNHSDFGVKIVSSQGHIQSLFSDFLSAVELGFTLKIKRGCCDCSNC